jgi:phosphomethylpyrimidine synthase
MCGPHFCSMELTQQVRELAEEKGLTTAEAIESGLEQKAREFREADLVQLPGSRPAG